MNISNLIGTLLSHISYCNEINADARLKDLCSTRIMQSKNLKTYSNRTILFLSMHRMAYRCMGRFMNTCQAQSLSAYGERERS